MNLLFQEVIEGYVQATKEDFGGHWIANKFRTEYPNQIRNLIFNEKRYKVEGSSGKGQWTHCPWIAILDRLITETPQKGYYPVIVFRSDMSGFYLFLNQGVTDIKNRYKSKAKEFLKYEAEGFRGRIGEIPEGFSSAPIDLRGKSETVKLYEAGSIFAKFYSQDALPTADHLRSDLISIIKVYKRLVYNDSSFVVEGGATSKGIENFKDLRMHYLVDRNSGLAKEVKKIKGYTCEACDFDFMSKYGPLGENFIEAHHLTPVAKLKGQILELDPIKDFAVLCSNCHRMIHRLEDPSDIQGLRELIRENRY